MNLRKKGESDLSVISRILTNYVQVISTSVSFNFKWPSFFEKSYEPVMDVSEAGEQIISFDCFLEDANLTLFHSSTFILKTFISAFTPILVFLVIALCWVIAKAIFRKRIGFVNGLIMSTVVIIYFMHTMLTDIMLGLFKCYPVEGRSLLERDMTIEC